LKQYIYHAAVGLCSLDDFSVECAASVLPGP